MSAPRLQSHLALSNMNGSEAPLAAVVGAGPAGLMAAEVLVGEGFRVTVYDQMPSAGRKFLLAGRGGLNLTHSETLSSFIARYAKTEPYLAAALVAFPPAKVIAWCEGLGQPVFVGSSGRVFPKTMKASPLLRAWLGRLRDLRGDFKLRYHWNGWDKAGRLLFTTPDGIASASPAVTVLALGGASWPRLGSDGSWLEILRREGVCVSQMKPTNCGFHANLSEYFLTRFQGQPLNGIEVRFGARTGSRRGCDYQIRSRRRSDLCSFISHSKCHREQRIRRH